MACFLPATTICGRTLATGTPEDDLDELDNAHDVFLWGENREQKR
jgi:hypothetical protein